MPQKSKFTNALGLDIGEKRIGVARVSSVARLPEPLQTIENTPEVGTTIKDIASQQEIDLIVIGLPRNMSGEETKQSQTVRGFVSDILKPSVDTEVVFQDETLSSVAAETYPLEMIQKYGSDSLAAVEILQDFLEAEEG